MKSATPIFCKLGFIKDQRLSSKAFRSLTSTYIVLNGAHMSVNVQQYKTYKIISPRLGVQFIIDT
jgi:hypothetical protein